MSTVLSTETDSSAPVLDVRELQVELMTNRGVIRAVDGVSFSIHRGETVTLIGESGSGKSTTAMGILRLLPDELAVISGHATIKGHDVVGSRKEIDQLRGRSVALIPQDPMTALNPIRTVGRQMVEAIRIRRPELSKAAASDRALELLTQVHIREPQSRLKAYPHELSGGMLQRVLIAMAISAEAELLVADEPTSALDVTVQAGILDLLLELQETTGVAIMMITHDLGVARLMSDRIHVMRAGKFVESGEAEQIVDSPAEPYTQALLAAIPDLGPWNDPALEHPELAAEAAAAAVRAHAQEASV
ncbi:ABC transporter ATP-binding protein [Nakamurella deserti]|uniref:ABC transporter ATP-binding protein n=1 Tax=Nakamurella deserti TaxID=2164074 RepID=UPI000DBE456D|nr:ABC transporter ATP-binding protein [Nakamurella deserti]